MRRHLLPHLLNLPQSKRPNSPLLLHLHTTFRSISTHTPPQLLHLLQIYNRFTPPLQSIPLLNHLHSLLPHLPLKFSPKLPLLLPRIHLFYGNRNDRFFGD